MDFEFEETEVLQDDLVCGICDAEFLDKEDLELHITQLHLNEHNRQRFCKLCAHIYPDIHEYALHIRNKHLSELKSCKHCYKLFASTPEVQEHESKHKAGLLYPRVACSQCDQVFDKNAIRNHELNEHSGTDEGMLSKNCLPIMSSLLCMNINDFLAAMHCNLMYTCIICKHTTLDVKEYIQHLRDSRCSSCACDNCFNVYQQKYLARKHVKTHFSQPSAVPNRKCPKCSMVIKTPLKVHLPSCKVVTCKQCELTFKSVVEYTNHRLTKHSTDQLSVEVCIYCQRHLVGASAMKRHMEKTHGKDKHLYKYHCTDCDKIFKHPKLLFAHFYSKHRDLQPYTCRICNEKFRIRKNFTLHIKLKHNSVGFVEFDDNFQVYFTDKKSAHKPNENKSNIELDTSTNRDDGSEGIESINSNETDVENDHELTKPIENNESNSYKDDENGKQPDSSGETEITSIDDHCKMDQVFKTECNVTKKKLKSNDIKDIKTKDDEDRDRNDDTFIEITLEKDDLHLEKSKKKTLKRKQNTTKKVGDNFDYDISSEDSDVPLKMVRKKMKRQKKTKNRHAFNKVPLSIAKKKKFYCHKCNRNCYTYQNYHRHLAMHTKNETKVCIKCFGKFNSVKELNEHVKNEHSSSQLTETLKKLLEKRKKAEENTKVVPNTHHSEEPPENIEAAVEESTSDKFRNTIKKVNIGRNTAKVTMKLIDKNKISVKKFLESFNPDNNEVKITILQTVAQTAMKRLRPIIKLTKANTEPVLETEGPKLKMPVKFTDSFNDKCKVSIKLTTDYVAPKMTFNTIYYDDLNDDFNDQNDGNTYNEYDDRNMDNDGDTKDAIPEVAQEVMLEGTEEPNNVHMHTIKNLPLPAWHKVQIATLSNEAPYFKITKIDLDNKEPFIIPEEEPEEVAPKEVILPNGTKLVSTNPYAHLLDDKKIEELINAKKRKPYYKPKLGNPAQAITKALENIVKSPLVKAKARKEKKNVV